MKTIMQAGALALALLAGAGCKSSSDQKADNTGKNERDRGNTKVADQAVDNDADLEITEQIRKAVVADAALSMNAKNVKIVVHVGEVTLRGPVASAEERALIERIAKNTAGTRTVVNELEIAP